MDDDILEILSGKLTLRDLAVREIKYLREKIASRDKTITKINSECNELNRLNSDLREDVLENARIIGMSAEREMTLLARITSLETEVARLKRWQEINMDEDNGN